MELEKHQLFTLSNRHLYISIKMEIESGIASEVVHYCTLESLV